MYGLLIDMTQNYILNPIKVFSILFKINWKVKKEVQKKTSLILILLSLNYKILMGSIQCISASMVALYQSLSIWNVFKEMRGGQLRDLLSVNGNKEKFR